MKVFEEKKRKIIVLQDIFFFSGITVLRVGDQHVLMTEALKVAEDDLMGEYASLWPLTKVLDIGGTARRPKYQNENVDITESM